MIELKTELIDIRPVQMLLDKHAAHTEPYFITFMGLQILLQPEVFNPTYTKVSEFLAKNIVVKQGQSVLEMFCGSGAIGLSTVHHASSIVGVDISPKAVECAKENAAQLGVTDKVEFRQGSLWHVIHPSEKFDVILANPPLLPAIPETLLEMSVADSPEMTLTRRFIAGLHDHLNDEGHALMAFSNACSVYVGDPLEFIRQQAMLADVACEVVDEWDVGYEVYRVIKFSKTGGT
jgi:methylase of polypeptide subunit release factors